MEGRIPSRPAAYTRVKFGAGLRGKRFFIGVLVCVVAVGTYMPSATVFFVRALFEMELNLP